jgi:hypothetical protein
MDLDSWLLALDPKPVNPWGSWLTSSDNQESWTKMHRSSYYKTLQETPSLGFAQ